MKSDPQSYDFFVSYARADNANGWITNFVKNLVDEHLTFAAGRKLKEYFDKKEITTGADWQIHLNEGIAHSRLFLAFISPNYLSSEWCRKEWRAWIDTEIAKHILTAGVRPIYIIEMPGLTGAGQLGDLELTRRLAELTPQAPADKAKMLAETPPVLKHLRRRQLTHNQPFCDVQAFFDAGLDALRRNDLSEVLNLLAHDLGHHADLLARADASRSTVPAYNKNFTGRLDELLLLRERLVTDDRTGVIYGLYGLGGIGKTELSYAYAHAFAHAYAGGRFLIRCEGKTSLRDSILAQSDFTLLFQLEITDEQRLQPDTHFAAVLTCLQTRIDSLGHVLLVLDNVSDLALLSPTQTDTLTVLGPQLHLLATTRLVPPAAGTGNWLSLGRLPDDDALEMLEKFRPIASDDERNAASSIVKRLGGFTLAIELVAAWLAKHREVSCADFLQRLGIEDIEALDALAEESDVTLRRHNDERRLVAVLDPTLDTLTPAARRALEFAALLPPDHVPLPWLRPLVGADFPELIAAPRPGYPDPWQTLVNQLTGLTLFIRPESETSEPRLLAVHRLVQDRVRRRMSAEVLATTRQALADCVRERANALENETRWEDASWELEPLEALAWLWAEPDQADSSSDSFHPTKHEEASWLLNVVGRYRMLLAEWSLAEPLYRRALAIDEARFNTGLSDILVGQANFASLIQARVDIARDLKNLSNLLQATNRLADAEPLIRQALEFNELIYGADSAEVATILGELARLLLATNCLAEAELHMRRALAIDEDRYGVGHHHTAPHLNNLALLLQATNSLIEAEQLLRRALAIGEDSHGPDHPDVATALNNLSVLLVNTNRHIEAESLIRRTIAIYEKSFGTDHPYVATALSNLGSVMKATNRFAEAESYYRRALVIYEYSYGTNHPDIALCLNWLAAVLQSSNRLADAEPLMQRALVINENSFGIDHPRFATNLYGLALLLDDANRLAEAECLYRRALASYKASLGADHPDVERCLSSLAELLLRT